MTYSKAQLWRRFNTYYTAFPEVGLAIDISRMNFDDKFIESMQPALGKAFAAMAELERGAIANPDEKRMVGHYWLRNPVLAPTPEIRAEIETTIQAVKSFAGEVHSGTLRGASGPFKRLLLIGIGGSALGPQFVSAALGQPTTDKLSVHFFDNTDPDGFDRVLDQIGAELGQTLSVVVSKSGGTKETRNGMVEAERAYEQAGLRFAQHAVAITSAGSELDKHAKAKGWLRCFPMWDWVGGRTSETSAVGLLPAALQGLDIDALLAGARACDEVTRTASWTQNPAAQMALMWFWAGNGKGERNLIVLPYKDRLELFSKYLQQLIMESLGKEMDLDGKVVNQGLSVLGNKGSTDQHAYVQQLRDGPNDFFVTFIEVLKERSGTAMEVEAGITSGDYLGGFFQGTRTALYEKGRQSITLTVSDVTPRTVGTLIALFERTVGLYSRLVNVNAYHQPGVEAGKKAAGAVLTLQAKTMGFLARHGTAATADEIAAGIGASEDAEAVFKICERLAANPGRKVQRLSGKSLADFRYKAS